MCRIYVPLKRCIFFTLLKCLLTVCVVSFKFFPMHAKMAAALMSRLLCILTHLLRIVLRGRWCCHHVSQKGRADSGQPVCTYTDDRSGLNCTYSVIQQAVVGIFMTIIHGYPTDVFNRFPHLSLFGWFFQFCFVLFRFNFSIHTWFHFFCKKGTYSKHYLSPYLFSPTICWSSVFISIYRFASFLFSPSSFLFRVA